MLKWTVANRRETDGETSVQRHPATNSCSITQRRSIDAIRERKERRRSARRASLCLRNRNDKENQCLSSTPTSKYTPETLYPSDTKVLRDVSNITPNTHPTSANHNRILQDNDTISTSNLSPPRTLMRQRKKQCVNPSHGRNYPDINEVKRLLLNESNICHTEPQIEIENERGTNFASTLPTFQTEYSPCSLINFCNPTNCTSKPTFPYQSLTTLPQFKSVLQDACSPSKKPKIDHVNDFLHQISFITSPEDIRIRNAKLIDLQNSNRTEINVSPLLRKISDLRFSKISYSPDDKVLPVSSPLDDSTAFNDMSLDKIVDAILDTTIGSEHLELRETELVQKDNEINQVNEENLVNNAQEKEEYLLRTETSDIVNNLNNTTQINEDTTKRKRTVSCTELSVSKRFMESIADSSFTLKRQKCIRRRKTILNPINNNILPDEIHYDLKETPTSTLKYIHQTDIETSLSYKDNSFSSSCLSGKNCTDTGIKENVHHFSSHNLDCLAYSSWEKDMCCGLSTPMLERLGGKGADLERKRALRRSLSSPFTIAASSTPTRSRDSSVSGTVDLQSQYKNGKLTVHGKSSIVFWLAHLICMCKAVLLVPKIL